MVFTPLILMLDGIGLAAIIGTGYYSFLMIGKMHKGLLEKSWRYMTIGAISLSIGVCLFVAASFVSIGTGTTLIQYVFEIGTVLVSLGAVFLFLGFHNHNGVWSVPREEDFRQEKLRDNYGR